MNIDKVLKTSKNDIEQEKISLPPIYIFLNMMTTVNAQDNNKEIANYNKYKTS